MTDKDYIIVSKRLQDILTCSNPDIKRARLQTLYNDLLGFDCPYANMLRGTIREQLA